MARRVTRPKKTSQPKEAPSRPADMLKDTWAATLTALTSAEAELEKQVRSLLKRNKISLDDAGDMLRELGTRVDKERRKAAQDFEVRLRELQARVKKERLNVKRFANEAVKSALATLNIPNRGEVADLTRKVQELSRRIDTLRSRSAKAPRRLL